MGHSIWHGSVHRPHLSLESMAHLYGAQILRSLVHENLHLSFKPSHSIAGTGRNHYKREDTAEALTEAMQAQGWGERQQREMPKHAALQACVVLFGTKPLAVEIWCGIHQAVTCIQTQSGNSCNQNTYRWGCQALCKLSQCYEVKEDYWGTLRIPAALLRVLCFVEVATPFHQLCGLWMSTFCQALHCILEALSTVSFINTN